MQTAIHFRAPWSRQLKWLTALTAALLIGLHLVLYHRAPAHHTIPYQMAIWLPLAILLISALFAIRGYAIDGQTLWILRPGWKTRIDLAQLRSSEVQPDATRAAIRVFGNGGLFGYIGLFRNRTLGRYRAFATNMANCVVLKFPDRTLVVTPDRPQQFVAALELSVPH